MDFAQVGVKSPLTLGRGRCQLTIHIVDLEASKVFGSARLGGRQQCRVVNGEVTVVVLEDGEGRSLNAGRGGTAHGGGEWREKNPCRLHDGNFKVLLTVEMLLCLSIIYKVTNIGFMQRGAELLVSKRPHPLLMKGLFYDLLSVNIILMG